MESAEAPRSAELKSRPVMLQNAVRSLADLEISLPVPGVARIRVSDGDLKISAGWHRGPLPDIRENHPVQRNYQGETVRTQAT